MKMVAIIGAIILLFQFPLFITGIGIAIWATYEWKINKKMHARSRKPAALLSIGMVIALTGCMMTVNEPTSVDTATESDVAGVATVEKDTDKEKAAKQTEKEEAERLAEEAKAKVEAKAKEEELAKTKEEEQAEAEKKNKKL